MARIIDGYSLKISFKGTEEAVEALKNALAARETEAVLQAWQYVKQYGGKMKKDGLSFYFGDETVCNPMPAPFAALSRGFPDAAFVFVFHYFGTSSGAAGEGFYYCIFEGGKKVYDAEVWEDEEDEEACIDEAYEWKHYLEAKNAGKLPSLHSDRGGLFAEFDGDA